jgi:hypothetical protein
MICNCCGGRGHVGRDCPSEKIVTPKPDDGTSKPKANVDRDFTFRDSTKTNNRNSKNSTNDSKKDLCKLKRKLSAEEHVSPPFIEGTTNPCSVSVGGKTCGGKHRHAKCPVLPAAKAERADQAAASGNPAALLFALPGQDPG